jgi:hypothetical protein
MRTRSLLLSIAFVALLQSVAFAQKHCCLCKSPSQYYNAEGSPCTQACPARAANGIWVANTEWDVNRDASCDTQPPEVTPDNIREKAKYNIYHQAADVWVPGTDAGMLKGEELRQELMGHDQDKRLLQLAPIDVLETETKNAVAECVKERSIDGDFEYVCSTKRLHPQMVSGLQQGNFRGVRSLFGKNQDNDEIRYRIYCRSNAEVADLVRAHCPNAAPPPKPPPLVPRNGGGPEGKSFMGRSNSHLVLILGAVGLVIITAAILVGRRRNRRP